MPRDKFHLIENQCPMEEDFLFDFNFTTGKATSATTNIIHGTRYIVLSFNFLYDFFMVPVTQTLSL
jgi:hypothetical protein